MLGDLPLQPLPVPPVAGPHVPEVELQPPLGRRRPVVRLVRPFLRRELHRRLAGAVVYRLEDVLVQLTRLLGLERELHHLEGVGQSLHADADRAVAHVGPAGLLHRVEVPVDHTVEVLGNDLGDVPEIFEVEGPGPPEAVRGGDELRQAYRREVAHRYLVGGSVLDDFRA